MSLASDLAAAQKAAVDRATDGNPTSMRRATVISVSPFTISMNGVAILSPPRLPSYAPVAGDVVLVLMDGAAPLVVASLSSGWVVDSARNPIVKTAGGNETRGNAVVVARYRITDGHCEWQGHYVLGNTTSWPVGALSLVLPVLPENSYFVAASTSIPGGFVRAFNGASYFYANVEYVGGGALGTAQLLAQNVSTTASVPWSINTVPFAFTTNYILSWNLRYPIA